MIFIPQPGIRNIVHHQTVPSTEWVITHNYTNAPNMAIDTMIEVNGQMQTVIPRDVIYEDDNTIRVIWSQAHVGWARLG